jgi:hypothetical protein
MAGFEIIRGFIGLFGTKKTVATVIRLPSHIN